MPVYRKITNSPKLIALTFVFIALMLVASAGSIFFTSKSENLLGLPPISLGIDLTGGSRLTLELNKDVVIDNINKDLSNLISAHAIINNFELGKNSLIVEAEINDSNSLLSELSAAYPNLQVSFDKETIHISGLKNIINTFTAEAIKGNIDVINTRLNSLGLADVSVYKQGADKVIVELPMGMDLDKTKSILTSTSQINIYLTTLEPNGTTLNYGGYSVTRTHNSIISGKDILSATPIIDNTSGQPSITIRLTTDAGRRMGKVTSENINEPLVTTLSEGFGTSLTESVLTVATIRSAFSRDFSLSGVGTYEENEELALVLRSGVMKAPMDIASEEEIAPSLGSVNVESSIRALCFAILALFTYIVWMYKGKGIISCLTLLTTASILILFMSLYGASFTMMSVVGVVLTMGMAVDINVIVFEKMKNAGCTIKTAFDDSKNTIIDANLTTAMAAQALFIFGSTQLKGLALVMVLGIIASLISSYWLNKKILLGMLETDKESI